MRKFNLVLLFVLVMMVFSGGVYAGEREDRERAKALEEKFKAKSAEVLNLEKKFDEKYPEPNAKEESLSRVVRDASWAVRKYLGEDWSDKVWIREIVFYYNFFDKSAEGLIVFYEDAIKRAGDDGKPGGEVDVALILEDK